MTKSSTRLAPSFAPGRPGKGGKSLGCVRSGRMMAVSWFLISGVTLPGLGISSAGVTSGSVRGNLPLEQGSLAGISSLSLGESALPRPFHSKRRQRELRWLQTHREELRKFAGQWIAIEGEEIVAHGPNAAEVAREARSRGVRVPFIHRVEHERPTGVVYLGL